MASPFPGMDPYLEAHWGDVHASLIIYMRDQLNGGLPGDLRARVEERVTVESPSRDDKVLIPDLRVIERETATRRKRRSSNGSVAVAEPLVVPADDEITETYIEIRDRKSGDRVVTVIEVLSLSNKLFGANHTKYLAKRDQLRAAQVNLVEIDLLRAGERPLPIDPSRLPPSHRTPYLAWARRAANDNLEIYRIALNMPLPAIRIPLRASDDDVPLQLQPLIEQCYANGDYDGDLDYARELDPALNGADKRWADALLRKAGRRKARRGGSRAKGGGKG